VNDGVGSFDERAQRSGVGQVSLHDACAGVRKRQRRRRGTDEGRDGVAAAAQRSEEAPARVSARPCEGDVQSGAPSRAMPKAQFNPDAGSAANRGNRL
jgi:hypothetical protein